MKKYSRIIIGFVIAVFIGSLLANAAFGQEYNARDEFALTQGGANGLWNYGYSTSDADNTLNLFNAATDADSVPIGCGSPFERWRIANAETIPQIARHNPAVTCANIPSNTLFIHPGKNNQRAVFRFNAPISGTFQISGSFQKQSLSATSDLKIIKNAALPGETVLYTGAIGAVYQQTFNFTVTITAGDKIDFSVGDDGNDTWQNDGSSIAVTIGQPVAVCLTAPANLQVNVPGENSPTDVQSVNTNASLVGDATYNNMGKVGRAFELDGNGDYIRVEDNAAQRPATAVTVEGWFKFDSVSSIVSLISKPIRNSALNSYTLYLDGGQLRGLVSNGPQFTRASSNFSPQTGVWHHLAFSYDFTGGVSTLKLYANGVEVTTGTDGTANILPFYDANPYPLLIGGEFENNAPGFTLDGQADEVSVYGRALTQTEIFDIVQQGSFGKCSLAACVQTANNLVSWFAGEQNALDLRSNNHGTSQNGATFGAGRVGQGFSFDGVDDRVVVPNSPSLDITSNQLTIEAWINPSDSTDNQIVSMADGTDLADRKYGLSVTSNLLSFEIETANGRVEAVAGSIPVGTFTHVAGVYNGSQMIWYVNGNAVNSVAQSGNIVSSASNFYIGQFAVGGFSTFNGTIDEVGIYNRGLTATEIQSIYNAGQSGKCKPIATNPTANQIAWFSGDGDTRDFLGLNPNGMLNGNASFTVGKVGQSFNFDGSGDNVELASNANFNPTSQMTLETWVYKRTGGDADLVGKDGETSERQYWLGAASNSRFRPHLSTTNNGLVFFDGATQYDLNTWYHLVMTYDGATLRLYVNGVLDGQTAASGSIITTSQPFRIGGGAPTGQLQNHLNGKLDEVSLYSRALSPSEIAAIYNAGTAGKLKSVTTPVNLSRNARTSASFAPTTVQLTDATVTFAQVTTAGTTSQSGIDLGLLPKFADTLTATGLNYDISTTAAFTTATICFNLPSISDSTAFSRLRILHLENGNWIERTDTASLNFATKTVCTSALSTLSPFAIVQGLAPTAAQVSIGGKIAATDGAGIRNAVVTLTDNQGNTRTTRTSSFGHYRFDEVEVGQTYVVGVQSKRFQFTPNTQIISVSEDLSEVDFVGFAP